MLISCPKCHSIYEIPDDLIGKTGQNFRCQVCANVWHAMRSDALGYEEKDNDKPLIEPLSVAEGESRPFPSEREEFTVPADSRPGRRVPSSADILAEAGIPLVSQNKAEAANTPEPPVPETPKILTSAQILNAAQQQQQKHELTLMSDHGTAFTISMDIPGEKEDRAAASGVSRTAAPEETPERREPHLFAAAPQNVAPVIIPRPEDRLDTPPPFKGYRKTWLFLCLLFLAGLALFMRREIVSAYLPAEAWYQKIGLSGLDNRQYLKFEKISVRSTTQKGKDILLVTAVIANNSRYATKVPPVRVNSGAETHAPERTLLKGMEKTRAVFALPQQNTPVNLNLSFAEP